MRLPDPEKEFPEAVEQKARNGNLVWLGVVLLLAGLPPLIPVIDYFGARSHVSYHDGVPIWQPDSEGHYWVTNNKGDVEEINPPIRVDHWSAGNATVYGLLSILLLAGGTWVLLSAKGSVDRRRATSREQFDSLAGVDPTQRGGVGTAPATDSPTLPVTPIIRDADEPDNSKKSPRDESVHSERRESIGAQKSFRPAGILLILAGPVSLGLTTTDPTNPSLLAILIMLTAYLGAFFSFARKHAGALICTWTFVIVTAISAFAGIVNSKFSGPTIVYPIEFLICGGAGCLLGLGALNNLRNAIRSQKGPNKYGLDPLTMPSETTIGGPTATACSVTDKPQGKPQSRAPLIVGISGAFVMAIALLLQEIPRMAVRVLPVLNPVARLFHIRGPYGVLVLSGGFLGLIGVILGTVAIVRKGWAKYALLGTCAGGLAIAACFVMRMSFLPELYEVKALLKHNPDMVFTKDGEGMTPLHRAAMRGQKDIAELLLANRADVNAKDDHGWTPLQETAVWYSQDAEQERAKDGVAEALLRSGADVDARDHEGKTPLHNAASTGKKELAQLLLTNNADVNALSDRGETPLHLAAQCGSKDVVALLLANRADVNAKDKDGATPLDYAAKSGHKEVVELLVANKAEVANIYDAAACGDLDRIMKFLKDDPDLVSKKYSFYEQLTPLHFASLNGQKDAAVLLLSRKSDVNAANNVGATPLHCAAAHCHAEVAAVLLDNNANVNAEDNAGATPLDWALAKGMPFGRAVAEGSNDVADILRKHGGIATGKHW